MASSMKHELAGRLGLVYLVVIGIGGVDRDAGSVCPGVEGR